MWCHNGIDNMTENEYRLTVRFTDTQKEVLKDYSKVVDNSVGSIIRLAVIEYLRSRGYKDDL